LLLVGAFEEGAREPEVEQGVFEDLAPRGVEPSEGGVLPDGPVLGGKRALRHFDVKGRDEHEGLVEDLAQLGAVAHAGQVGHGAPGAP